MTEARQILIDWANEQSGWVKLVVKEVIDTGSPIPEDILEEIYKYFLIEKELEPGAVSPIEAVQFIEEAGNTSETFYLKEISGVTNVNRLTTGQDIKFNKGITLIFGENASGKSGYVRILKRLAATRSQENILSDVTKDTQSAPRAVLSYGVAENDFNYTWNGEGRVAPFNRISIFDSRALISHVDEDLTYVYTPRDLSLFKLTHTALEWMRTRLDVSRKKIKPTSNPYLKSFSRDSSIYTKIETLGAASDLKELEELAKFNTNDESEIGPLKEQIEALNPQLILPKLEGAESRKALLAHGTDLATIVKNFNWKGYNDLVSNLVSAKEKYSQATEKAFIGDSIPGFLTESWKKFIEAGDTFLKENSFANYPERGDACIYCQQPLEVAAVDLLNKYKAYCNDSLKKDILEIEKDIRKFSLVLSYSDLEIYIKTLQKKLDNSQSQNKELLSLKLKFASQYQEMFERVKHLNTVESSEVVELANNVFEECNKLLISTQELISVLKKQGEERRAALLANLPKLRNLEARKTLKTIFPEVKLHVENAKWASKSESIIGSFSNLLRSLTAQTKVASEDLVNKDFQKFFEKESAALKAPTVRLDFPGQRGEAARRKSLNTRYRLSDILSEGEQKVIALADFLAETSIRSIPSPLVFDDPVNSLDHKRIEHIANRMYELSTDQQVIVFTHNIWFATSLLSRFESETSRCTYYDMADSNGTPGFVTSGTHPRWDTTSKLSGRINGLIQTASSSSVDNETKQALIESAYGVLRSWCEVVVEQELLQKVAQRYTPHIMMGGLSKIKYDKLSSAVGVIFPVFEKCCRIMDGHSQPLETLGIRATIEELRSDWDVAQTALRIYKN